jgi:hypothetical protein
MTTGSLFDDMSVTIFYRHPARPGEAGMTHVPNEADAAALKGQLAKRGFQVVGIVSAPNTIPAFSPVPQSAPSPQPGADD